MRGALVIPVVIVASTCAGAAAAQTPAGAPEIGFSSIPFQFFPPGARSLAMGATFVGIADDATAAASNPAGLVILTRPEASAHGRLTRFADSVSRGYTQPSTTAFSPSYASVVVPRKPVSVSAYYQQVSNIDLGRSFSGPVLFRGQTQPTTFRSASRIDLLVADLGLSGAVTVRGRVSLGATLAQRKTSLGYFNENTIIGDRNRTLTDQASAAQSDHAIVFNAGALVNPNGRLSVGAVFKRGGRFHIPYVVDFEGAPAGAVSCPRPGVCDAGALQIPDTWGLGVALRPSGSWLLASDIALVRYSQLSATIFRAIPFDIYPLPNPTSELGLSRFEDILQLHLGAERIFTGRPAIGVRAGVYHRPNFNRGGNVDAGATFFTAGLGLVFGDRGQLDLAGSLSRGVGEGLASLVVRF